MGSIGGGYRQVTSADNILGGYFFVDSNFTPNNNTFVTLSPGIESIGKVWDFHANAYIPVGNHKVTVKYITAFQQNNFSHETFLGHQEFSPLYKTAEMTGAGLDAEVGYTLPWLNNLHAFVGGYFFSMPQQITNIKGAAGSIEYSVNQHLTVEAADTYDNLNNNTFRLGIRFSFRCAKTRQVPIFMITC